MDIFAERLRRERRLRKLSQQALAKRMSLRPATIGKYENCRSTPTLAGLVKIANILHVSADYLLGLTDCKNTIVGGRTVDLYQARKMIGSIQLPEWVVPATGPLQGIVVTDHMMLPGVLAGDVLMVEKCEHYASGDWILYDAQDTYWLGEYYVRAMYVVLNIHLSDGKTIPTFFKRREGKIVGKLVAKIKRQYGG